MSSPVITQITNTSGVGKFFGFIPPHGQFLTAGQSIIVDGIALDALAFKTNRTAAQAFINAVTNGDISVTHDISGEQSSGGGGGGTTVDVFKLSDGTPVNNDAITFHADPDLQFSVEANQIWRFEVGLFWNSPSTGLQVDFTYPGGIAFIKAASIPTGLQSNQGATLLIPADADGPIQLLGGGGGGFNGDGNQFDIIWGIVKIGATPGTVQLRFHQSSPVVEDSVLKTGSYLGARLIG